jgi:hypothetical protein
MISELLLAAWLLAGFPMGANADSSALSLSAQVGQKLFFDKMMVSALRDPAAGSCRTGARQHWPTRCSFPFWLPTR